MSPKLTKIFLAGLLVLCGLGAAAVQAAPANPGLAFLARVDAEVAAGALTEEQGLLYKLQYGFAPEKLPPAYRPDGFHPLKNGTQIVWEYVQSRDRLSPRIVAEVEAYLAPPTAKATYVSPSGRFQMNYDTSGTHAVPTTDTTNAAAVKALRCLAVMVALLPSPP